MSTPNLFKVSLLVLVAALPLRGYSGDISSVVQDEFKSVQTEVANELAKSQHKVSELQARREHVLAETKARADQERDGIALMEKYNLLLAGRYLNDAGEFQGGMEILAKDQDAINKIFEKFLYSTPLQGKISAGEAHRTLDWGAKRLAELARIHSESSESNNSELEIIAYELKQAGAGVRKVTQLANTLGIKVDGPSNSDRLPGSTNSSK